MSRCLVTFLTICAWSSSSAQVVIDQASPPTFIFGTVHASFDDEYLYTSNVGSFISVSPDASGNLAGPTFSDGLSYSGSAVPACPGCTGTLGIAMPNLTIADGFTLTTKPGQLIPWSLTLVATPQFVSASSNVFDNEMFQTLVVLEGATGIGGQTACFSNHATGCGAAGISSPNNVPYTMMFSGLISSGGNLSFSAGSSGVSNFVDGPNTASVSTDFGLDGRLELSVPQGVTVVSQSGVFPVERVLPVPEESTFTYLLVGLAASCLFARRAQTRKARRSA